MYYCCCNDLTEEDLKDMSFEEYLEIQRCCVCQNTIKQFYESLDDANKEKH